MSLPLPWVAKVPQMPELLAALSCTRLDRLQGAGALSAVRHTGYSCVEQTQHNRRQHRLMSGDTRRARAWRCNAVQLGWRLRQASLAQGLRQGP